MESSPLSKTVKDELIYCLVRKVWVAALPEERVRQQLIERMVHQLGYPVGYLAVEKDIRQMPHLTLKDHKAPDRRADILCYAQGIHPEHALYPLLLVECKAIKLTKKVTNQVLGYNHFVGAYFVAIANEEEIQLGWYDPIQKNYRFVKDLPPFASLRRCV